MRNETKQELLLVLSVIFFGIGVIIFIDIIVFTEPFWLQLKRYWVHIALVGVLGFLFLKASREIQKKSNLPDKITPGKFYAGRTLGRQHKRW